MGGERCCYGISYYCPASLGLSTVTIQNVDIWYYPQALLVSPIDWHVLAFDWRGWAESSTHRSYASGFSVFETWGRETLRLAT